MTPIIALCCGALMILTVLPGVDNRGQNLTTTYDKYSCFDGQAYIFDELQLPYASAALPRGITEFYVEDGQIEPGIRPRIDAKIQISLSESIASEDLGIVSAHVNGKTFIQLRIEPEVNKPENTLWTTATLTDNTVEGRFNALDIVVDISNYLQHNSLVKGVNTLEVSLENIRGARLETARLLHPTQLVIDARSSQLLSLGVATGEKIWYLDEEVALEIVVGVQGDCSVDGVSVDVVSANGLEFDKQPEELLDPVNVDTQPVAARFGMTPREIGSLEIFVSATAEGQEEAVALVTRSVVARESSRVDAAQPLGYLLLGLLAALGAWLLLSSRRHSPDA